MSANGPKRWSLYEIEVLSHHHVSPAPFPRASAPGYPVVIEKLRGLGLMEALATARLGENATAEDVRGFLFKTFDALRFVAQANAGLPITKPN